MEKKKQIKAVNEFIYIARAIAVTSLLFIAGSSILITSLLWKETPDSVPVAAQQIPVKSLIAAPVVAKSRVIPADAWKAPNESTIPAGKYGNMIRYGKELVTNTSKYFGPNGSIAHISNGMNCQNCHLLGGTKLFGNNYSVFVASYPKKSARSGKVEPASARIAECFKRSMAGQTPDSSGKEVQAMLAYMKWVGTGVKKGDKVFGNASEKLKYMDRAADAERGMRVYSKKCRSCHGADGQGVLAADKLAYTYPPLWGKHSYNDAAGMYRLSNLAGFVKNNMPYGASYADPQLSDEEAWDVAAFIESQPRAHKDQKKDYPDLTEKPFDAPYGPYADQFTEKQHKYGPFSPIVAADKLLKSKHGNSKV